MTEHGIAAGPKTSPAGKNLAKKTSEYGKAGKPAIATDNTVSTIISFATTG